MEEEKAKFIFECAEKTLRDWLAIIVEQPADELFGTGYEPKRKLYIKACEKEYELSLKIVPRNYEICYSEFPQKVLEGVGFLIYAVKKVFPALIETARQDIREISLTLDEKTNFFHASYTPEIIQHRDILMQKIINAKNAPELLEKYNNEMKALNPEITRISEEYRQINNSLFEKPHLAIDISII